MPQDHAYPSHTAAHETATDSQQRSAVAPVNVPASGLSLTRRSFILAILATAVFLLCLANGRGNSLIPGLPLQDPDDAMRLVQVIDLLDGQNWYDLTQDRVNPPDGLSMHWSRLPDLPLAAVIKVAERFIGRHDAVLLAAKLVPPLLGAGFFLAFVWAAVPMVGRDGGPYAALVCLTLLIPLAQLSTGRVHHYGLQLVLAMVTTGPCSEC